MGRLRGNHGGNAGWSLCNQVQPCPAEWSDVGQQRVGQDFAFDEARRRQIAARKVKSQLLHSPPE